MIMFKNTALLSAATLALLGFDAIASDVDKTLAWESGGEIRIEITAGQIEIRGWDKDEVKLTGDFSGEEDRLTFKKSGKNIKLGLEDERSSWWGGHSSGGVDFTVFAPMDSNLDIEGTSLRIEIEGIKGNLEANSISGSVRVSGPTKRIDIETVSGDVEINDASGKIHLRTVSGNIDANVEALTFDAKTVSGDIQGNIGRSEYANLLSVSGDIDIELSLIKDGRVEGQTVSGNLELSFNDTVNADFELNTGPGGDISNRITKDRVKNTDHWGQELRFSAGDGQGNVELETMSGTIKIK